MCDATHFWLIPVRRGRRACTPRGVSLFHRKQGDGGPLGSSGEFPQQVGRCAYLRPRQDLHERVAARAAPAGDEDRLPMAVP
jgi:hypothetical protein